MIDLKTLLKFPAKHFSLSKWESITLLAILIVFAKIASFFLLVVPGSQDEAEFVNALRTNMLPHGPHYVHYALGRFFSLFCDHALALSLVGLLSGIFVILYLYLIVRDIIDDRPIYKNIAAISAVCLFLCSLSFLQQSGGQEVRLTQLWFTLASLFYILRRKLVLAGTAAGLAFCTHYAEVFFFFTFLYAIIFNSPKTQIKNVLQFGASSLLIVGIIFLGFGLFINIPPTSNLNFLGMYKEYLNGPPGPEITQIITHPLSTFKNLLLHLWTHRKHYQSAMDYTFDIVSIGYFCALINLIFITKKQLLWAIYGLSYFWLFESLIGQAMLKMNPRIYTVYLAPALCISITLTFHHYCRKFIKSDVKRVVAWCIGIVLILQQSRGMEIWDRQYNWSKIISDYYSKDIVALMYADLVLPENDYIVTPHDASYNKMRNFVAKHSYIHTVGDYLEVFDELHNGAVFQIQDLMNYKADKARINSLILSRNVYALNKESLSKVVGYDTHLYIYEPIVIKFDRDMFQKHCHQPRYINAMSLPQEITIYRISIPQS